MSSKQNFFSYFGAVTAISSWLFVSANTHAATFNLPDVGDLIGQVQTVTVQKKETLLDVARQFDVGYNEIIAANPDIDPWLPEAGSIVTVPTRFILPNAPRKGVVINLAEMRLYYFPMDGSEGAGKVDTYPIGIGQQGWSTPVGVTRIIDKIKDPAWTVPDSILEKYKAEGRTQSKIMPSGPDNPLGGYALRLSLPKYLIHGTNEPYGIGRRVSHGCIRMYPEDIEIFFQRIPVDTSVWIVDQPYKLGQQQGVLYMEAHLPLSQPPITEPDVPIFVESETSKTGQGAVKNLERVLSAIEVVTHNGMRADAVNKARLVAEQHTGLPVQIVELPQQPQAVKKGWVVQLGAYKNIENATHMAVGLKAQGLAVELRARVNDGYCHVLVGPYDNQDVAGEARNRLTRSTGIETELLPADRYGLLSSCQP